MPGSGEPGAQAVPDPVAADRPPMTRAERANGSGSVRSGPSEDDIRVRAYHRYLERGGVHGMAFDDWLEAERELKLRG
jgi:Protein of unknown function (DUF2934)